MESIKILTITLIVVFCLQFKAGNCEENIQTSLKLFPDQPLFEKLKADLKEVQLSARLLLERGDFGGGIGYSVGLVEYRSSTWSLQARIEGNTFLVSKIQRPDFPVQSTDFTVSIPFHFKRNNWSGRAKIGHISSHLGDNFNRIDNVDDVISRNPSTERTYFTPSKYSREFIEALAAVRKKSLRIYGGMNWDFHIVKNSFFDRPKSLTIHYGVELSKRKLSQKFYPYFAVDARHLEEFNWSLDYNIQIGWMVENTSGKRMRIAFEIFRGQSFQGQFFRRKEKDINVVTLFDF